MSSRLHLRPRRWALFVVAGSTALSVGLGSTARADTVNQANQQAQQVAAQIAKLQPQVDAALASYDTALDGVAQTVSASVAAREVYASLQANADALAAQHNSRIAALYESGGSLSLYAGVVADGDPATLYQVPYLSGVVADDVMLADNARRLAAAAQAAVVANQVQISSDLANTDVVNQRLQDLQTLLNQQQTLLDQASSRARQLAALQQAAADLALSQAAAAQAGAQAAANVEPSAIPPLYRALFQAAAQTCPGLSWTVLAAIGQVETNDGSGGMVSTAGALGPMQFLPATFEQYATDGDHDGVANIMDPADAIFSAARYLCANGAGKGGTSLATAVWNYNHADWYVQLVLALAAKIS